MNENPISDNSRVFLEEIEALELNATEKGYLEWFIQVHYGRSGHRALVKSELKFKEELNLGFWFGQLPEADIPIILERISQLAPKATAGVARSSFFFPSAPTQVGDPGADFYKRDLISDEAPGESAMVPRHRLILRRTAIRMKNWTPNLYQCHLEAKLEIHKPSFCDGLSCALSFGLSLPKPVVLAEADNRALERAQFVSELRSSILKVISGY